MWSAQSSVFNSVLQQKWLFTQDKVGVVSSGSTVYYFETPYVHLNE